MGAIKEISCQSCGKVWQCHTGQGKSHLQFESVIQCFSPEKRAKMLAYLEQCDLYPQFDFSYRLAICPDCKQIVSIPVATWGEEQQITIGECPICGAKVNPIFEISTSCCPVCGEEHTLKIQEIGRWD